MLPSHFSHLILILTITLFHHQRSSAHNELESDEEIDRLIEAQSSIYHCYPQILDQLDRRRASIIISSRINRNHPSSSSSAAASSPSPLLLQHDQLPRSRISPPSKFDTLKFGSSESNLAYDLEDDNDDGDDEDDNDNDNGLNRDTLTCTRSQRRSYAERIRKVQNSTCVLAPVARSGPYYHTEGHPIRQNIVEWQDGLPLYLDIGVVDVDTCKPIKGALVDIWHANATGQYGGHPSPKPGYEDEKPQVGGFRAGLVTAYPRVNFEEQWLRGAWPTNELGVSRFATIFPGYYTGRATHVHMEVHMDWEPMPNGTFRSKDVQYIGQFFFEDEINMSVDKMWPYVNNPVRDRTRNWRDSLRIFRESSRAHGFRPVLDILKIGNVISEGLVGFITVGINASSHYPHNYEPIGVDDLDVF